MVMKSYWHWQCKLGLHSPFVFLSPSDSCAASLSLLDV